MPDKPTLDKFIKDPQFQADRELLDGYFEHFLAQKAEAARKKKEEDDKKNPKGIWDTIFGN
jgi:hypothetical protein